MVFMLRPEKSKRKQPFGEQRSMGSGDSKVKGLELQCLSFTQYTHYLYKWDPKGRLCKEGWRV